MAQSNRFRAPGALRQTSRGPPASPRNRPWSTQPGRNSFGTREVLEQRPTTTQLDTPTCADGNQSFLVNDNSLLGSGREQSSAGAPQASFSSQDNLKKDTGGSQDTTTSGSTGMCHESDDGHAGILRHQPGDIEEHFGTSLSEIEDMLEGLRDLSRIPAQIQEELLILRSIAQRQNQAIARQKESSSKLSREWHTLQEKFEELKITKEKSDNTVKEMEEELHQSSEACDRLRNRVRELENEEAVWRTKYDAGHKSWQLEGERLKERLTCSEEAMRAKESHTNAVEEELAYIQRRIEDEIARREKLTEEKNDAIAEILRLKGLLSMEKTSLGDVKEKHAAQVVELQRNHAGVIERVQKEGNVMLGKLRSDFSAQLGQVKKENNELLRERESERTVYENTVRQLKASLSQAERERSILSAEKEGFKQGLNALSALQKEYLQVIASSREGKEDSNIELGSPAFGNLALPSPSRDLPRFQNSTSEVENARVAVKITRDILLESARREVFLTYKLAATHNATGMCRATRKTLTELRNGAESAVAEVGLELRGMKKELQGLASAACQTQVERTKANEAVRRQLSRLGEEYCSLKRNFAGCDEELKRARTELREANSKLDSEKKTLGHELATAAEEKDLLQRDLCQLQQALQQCRRDSDAAKLSSEKTVEGLNSSLQQCRGELESRYLLQSKHKELLERESADKNDALKRLAACEERAQILEKDLDMSTKVAHSAGAEAEKRLSTVRNKLLQASEEVISMRKSLEAISETRDSTAKKLALNEDKLRRVTEELATLKGLMKDCEGSREKMAAWHSQHLGNGIRRSGCNVFDKGNSEYPPDMQGLHPGKSTGNESSYTKNERAACQDTVPGSDSSKLKKRQPNKSVHKMRNKKSRVKPPRAPSHASMREQGEASPSGKPGSRRGLASQTNGEEDEDWVVSSITRH